MLRSASVCNAPDCIAVNAALEGNSPAGLLKHASGDSCGKESLGYETAVDTANLPLMCVGNIPARTRSRRGIQFQ